MGLGIGPLAGQEETGGFGVPPAGAVDCGLEVYFDVPVWEPAEETADDGEETAEEADAADEEAKEDVTPESLPEEFSDEDEEALVGDFTHEGTENMTRNIIKNRRIFFISTFRHHYSGAAIFSV
jgi:hypothetical protein